jgi:TAT (twin-arginine translocation) pathway signal sequence
MNRRQLLKLGAVTGGVFALGGAMRTGGRSAFA